MKNLCRICRELCGKDSTKIFSDHDGIPLKEILIKTCPIDITSDDPISQSLPQSICTDCLEVVSAAYNLQHVCMESDNYFRSIVCSQTEIKEEPLEDFLEVTMEEEVECKIICTEKEAEPVTYLVPVEEKREPMKFNPRLSKNQPKVIPPYYDCSFCLKQIKGRQQAINHMQQEHDPISLPYGCDFCSARFKQNVQKLLHENAEHADGTPSCFKCQVCGVNGISQQGIANHTADDHRLSRKQKIVPITFEQEEMLVAFEDEDSYDRQLIDQNKIFKLSKNIVKNSKLASRNIVELSFASNAPKIFKNNKDQESIKSTQVSEHLVRKIQNKSPHIKIEKSPQVEKLDFNSKSLSESESKEPLRVYHVCNFCDKKTKKRANLLEHLNVHCPEKYPHGCEYCLKRYSNQEKLDAHVNFNHRDDQEKIILFCDICGASGNSKEGMQNHIIDDHLNPFGKPSSRRKLGLHTCRLCEAKYVEKTDLSLHMLAVHEEATGCFKCDKMFNNKWELDNHTMMVHEKLYRELEKDEIVVCLKCCYCERSHETEEKLIEHLPIHEESFSGDQVNGCLLCRNTFKDFDSFVDHAKYHAKPQTHQCLACQRKAPMDKKFIAHTKSHKHHAKQKVQCTKCNKTFPSKKYLESHDKIEHLNLTLFVCPVCAKSFSNATNLEQHIKYVHNKDKQKLFKCKSCPLTFPFKIKLKLHESIHSSERPFICETCGKSFKVPASLKQHTKLHDGPIEKNHVCNHCDKRFSKKNHLSRHMFSHTGEKPHKCTYCGRPFAHNADLIKHIKKLHVGDEFYKCNKCPKAFRIKIELNEHQSEHANDD